MGGFSFFHILIFAVIVLLLFGGNRFSAMMGDVAKGLKSFKAGMSDEDEARRDSRNPPPPAQLPPQQQTYAPPPQQAPIDITPQPRAADPVTPPPATPPSDDTAR